MYISGNMLNFYLYNHIENSQFRHPCFYTLGLVLLPTPMRLSSHAATSNDSVRWEKWHQTPLFTFYARHSLARQAELLRTQISGRF